MDIAVAKPAASIPSKIEKCRSMSVISKDFNRVRGMLVRPFASSLRSDGLVVFYRHCRLQALGLEKPQRYTDRPHAAFCPRRDA